MKLKNTVTHTGLLVLVGLFGIVVAGCSKSGTAVKEKKTETVYAVNTYKVGRESLDEYLEFGGDVAAVSSVDVLPDTGGKISHIYANVGDYVQKGQVIAAVNASRAGMTYSASPVKAPVSGTITLFPMVVGSMVSQSMSIAKISSTNELEIRSDVAERFISRVKTGQKAIVTFDAYPGATFTAKVFEVSPVLDQATRTMSIKLRLSPPDSRIKIGMYARIRLITDSHKNAIIVPAESVVTRSGKPYVFVIGQEKQPESASDKPKTKESAATEKEAVSYTIKLQQVSLGLHVDDKQEVTNGLAAGDQIVVKGQTLLNDGSLVNIISVVNDESPKSIEE
jgi:membrane fusion protein (multidrug efflux system)